MPKIRLLVLHFAALLSYIGVAQNGVPERMDSLWNSIQNEPITLHTYEHFEQNVFIYSAHSPTQTVEIGIILLDSARANNYIKGIGDVCSHLGNIYREEGLTSQAIEHYLIAIDQFNTIDLTGSYAFALINLGNVFYDSKQWDKAIEYYNRVLELEHETFDLAEAKAVAHNNIGLVYEDNGDKSKALRQYQLALDIRRAKNSNQLIVHSYQHFAILYCEYNQYDSAIYFLKEARQLIPQITESEIVKEERTWNNYFLFGKAYRLAEEYETANSYIDSSIVQAQRMGFINYEIASTISKAKINRLMYNPSVAVTFIKKAYTLAVDFKMSTATITALEEWIQIDLLRNDYRSAFEHQSEMWKLNSAVEDEASALELTSRAYEKQIERIQGEAKKSESIRILQDEKLNSQRKTTNLLYIFISTLLISAIAMAYLLILNWRKQRKIIDDNKLIRKQKEQIEKTNTKLRHTNTLLEESLNEKSKFMSKMSHEIRTPMNAIVGLSEVLLRQKLTADQEQLLRNISHSSQRLTSLVDDILNYSRLESGKVEIFDRNFSLHELIREIATLHQGRAEVNHTIIHVRVDSSIPEYLFGDADKLGQIINNLISNAVKFTENGHVYVRAFVDEQSENKLRLGIEVEDSGIGIAEEQIAHIFDEFQQANTEIHTRFGGTGLGLAICKQLVELLNGSINVKSTLGDGSTFSFSIPLSEGENPEEKAVTETIDLSNINILLVEDDRMNQFVAQRLLGPTQVQLTIASDGKEGLEKCLEKSFDLILMDIQMPIMNGFDAALAIRQLEAYKNTPIIALTADIQSSTKVKALQCGMVDLVTKPFKSEELIEAISKHLSKK